MDSTVYYISDGGEGKRFVFSQFDRKTFEARFPSVHILYECATEEFPHHLLRGGLTKFFEDMTEDEKWDDGFWHSCDGALGFACMLAAMEKKEE